MSNSTHNATETHIKKIGTNKENAHTNYMFKFIFTHICFFQPTFDCIFQSYAKILPIYVNVDRIYNDCFTFTRISGTRRNINSTNTYSNDRDEQQVITMFVCLPRVRVSVYCLCVSPCWLDVRSSHGQMWGLLRYQCLWWIT